MDKMISGEKVELNEDNLVKIGIDEGIIIDDNSLLFTDDIHTCIVVLVKGFKETGMCHFNIQGELNLSQQKILKQLLKIVNIKEIDVFTGPKTSIESVNELRKYITFNEYPAYINNPLGLEVATGNIACQNDLLYGHNDDGFVEYKKGYINALNCNELTKKL